MAVIDSVAMAPAFSYAESQGRQSPIALLTRETCKRAPSSLVSFITRHREKNTHYVEYITFRLGR